MSELHKDDMLESLAAFGCDLSRWPDDRAGAARRALLNRPDFRRAWEGARGLDEALAQERARVHRSIEESGAVARLSRRTLARVSASPLAGMRWERIAAAMLVAGMLGGALDLVMPDPAADSLDLALLDPLDADQAEVR